MNRSISVSGVWIRKHGIDDPMIQVLVEVPGKGFRIIYQEKVSSFKDGEVSHIVESPGIEAAPPDPLGD